MQYFTTRSIIGERERANLVVQLARIFYIYYIYIFLCRRRCTYRKCFQCFYVTLNLRVCMQYFTTRSIMDHGLSTSI